MGTLVVISSPSGAGKNSIIKRLLEIFPRSTRFVTTTTRNPRPGEKNGEDYFFISRNEFLSMQKADKFIEENEYAGEFYGSEKEKLNFALEKNDFVFAALDVNGKQTLDRLHIPHISLFLLPEDMSVLEQRIIDRGGVDEDKIRERLQIARLELRAAGMYDVRVVNPEGKMEVAVQKIVSYLQSE